MPAEDRRLIDIEQPWVIFAQCATWRRHIGHHDSYFHHGLFRSGPVFVWCPCNRFVGAAAPARRHADQHAQCEQPDPKGQTMTAADTIAAHDGTPIK
jgi:hypothetical protein